jgi:hypothetical protein
MKTQPNIEGQIPLYASNIEGQFSLYDSLGIWKPRNEKQGNRETPNKITL